ncbi:hypothetical protein GQ42DRAFT_160942 [Ramicandelaber brevisporus]|nr:hypothetical protein GQ42DRAFT_160942 [Ramicandelaber brevisporus]
MLRVPAATALKRHTSVSSASAISLVRNMSSSGAHFPSPSLQRWRDNVLKNTVVEHDTITASPIQLLDTTLNMSLLSGALPHSTTSSVDQTKPVPIPANGSILPPNYHMIYFPLRQPMAHLAEDGYDPTHAPPAPFLGRVWGGGSIELARGNPLRVGQDVTCTTRCKDVKWKQSRGKGDLIFVELEKVYTNKHGVALTDTRTLAYSIHEANKPPSATKPNKDPKAFSKTVTASQMASKVTKEHDFARVCKPDEVTLFRYSALTFNCHRIHYDTPYARDVEGHPHCLVHGPLTSTILLDLMRGNLPKGYEVAAFRYRALRPLYVSHEMKVFGKELDLPTTTIQLGFGEHMVKGEKDLKVYDLWAIDGASGETAMRGTALLRKISAAPRSKL